MSDHVADQIGFLDRVCLDRRLCGSRAAGQTAKPTPKPPAPLARWIEIQNATLNLRYRFADTSTGTVITNQVQHRETLRARVKFDTPGRYALNLGTFSGSRFTSGWNNTGIGLGDWQKTLAVRTLYFAAQPIAGVEGQYGSMYIVRGESSEITTYDEDGYVIGERVSVRRPKNLFFDEMSATVGYFTGSPAEIGVSKRVKYLERPAELRPLPRRQESRNARRCLRRFHIGRRRSHVEVGSQCQYSRAAHGRHDSD